MKTSCCIIQKKKEDFLLSWENPFYEKYQIQRDGIISFAPAGNGYWCYNQKTNTFFQDDVINVFQSTLCKRKIPIEK